MTNNSNSKYQRKLSDEALLQAYQQLVDLSNPETCFNYYNIFLAIEAKKAINNKKDYNEEIINYYDYPEGDLYRLDHDSSLHVFPISNCFEVENLEYDLNASESKEKLENIINFKLDFYEQNLFNHKKRTKTFSK